MPERIAREFVKFKLYINYFINFVKLSGKQLVKFNYFSIVREVSTSFIRPENSKYLPTSWIRHFTPHAYIVWHVHIRGKQKKQLDKHKASVFRVVVPQLLALLACGIWSRIYTPLFFKSNENSRVSCVLPRECACKCAQRVMCVWYPFSFHTLCKVRVISATALSLSFSDGRVRPTKRSTYSHRDFYIQPHSLLSSPT